MGGFRRPGRGGGVATPMVAIKVIRRGWGGEGVGVQPPGFP